MLPLDLSKKGSDLKKKKAKLKQKELEDFRLLLELEKYLFPCLNLHIYGSQ